jgi:hypothetical protein
VSIKLRKQSVDSVRIPTGLHVQLFVDVDGLPKVKGSDGAVIALSQSSALTLVEQEAAPDYDPNALKLYARGATDTGETELFIKDSNDVEIQVTKDGSIAGGGGLKPHPGFIGQPGVNEFVFADGSQTIVLPAAAAAGGRAGVYAAQATDVTVPDGQALYWGPVDNVVVGPDVITLPSGAYAEWVGCDFGDGNFGWVPAGASNEQVPGGGGGGGWLTFSTNNHPELGEWVIMGQSPISLPQITAGGQHVAFYVAPSFGPALVSSPDDFYLGRNNYNGGSNAPIQSGGWYEWVSQDQGEGFTWRSIATGDTSKPPLESAENAGVRPAYANMWSLGSRDTSIPLPYTKLDGDVYGIYADVACTVFCFSPGSKIESPDLSHTVTAPTVIPLTAGSYYEWIYTAGDDTWHPRQNQKMSPAGAKWLEYSAGFDVANGQWIVAADATSTFLPTATAAGQHIGVYVSIGNFAAEFRCAGSIVQMDRTVYAADNQIPTRPGAWYEWVSISISGVLRWVPVGGSGTSARPPLEHHLPAQTNDPVNKWLLASNQTTIELPVQLTHGDCIAIYADVSCQVRPAQSTFLQRPDLTSVVAWPTYITLPAGTYYEWIFTEQDNTWHPRQNMISSPTQAVISTPYQRPPTAPNAFNFEAKTAASADLAANGFTLRRNSDGAALTRAGEIDRFRARGTTTPALGALEYRSSLIDGRLYLQLPAINSVGFTLTKPITVPTTTTSHGATVWGKVMSAANYNGSGHSFLHVVGLYKATGAVPDPSNFAGSGYYYQNHIQQRFAYFGNQFVDNDLGLPGFDIRDIKIVTVQATTPDMTWYADLASSYTNNYQSYGSGVVAGSGSASLVKYAGISLDAGTNFTAACNLVPWHYCIDYLRLYTGNLTNVWVSDL